MSIRRHHGLQRALRLGCCLAVLGLAACRDADAIGAEFDALVEANASCASAAECTVIFTECPLGCYHAVRTDRVAQVEARADALVAEYEAWGRACAYDCTLAGEPFCEDGLCQVDSVEPGADAGVEDAG